MTAVLCTASSAKVHMRVTSTGDDTLIQSLVDSTEAAFLSACGRSYRPFATSATAVTEVHDGTQTRQIVLNYPIAAITSIKIGRDVTDPVETLDATDVDVVVFATGQRAIYRTDGGLWNTSSRNVQTSDVPPVRENRIVTVVYDHDADLPDIAKLAIHREVARVYRQIGSEDARSEGLPDGYNRNLAGEPDAIWRAAIDSQAGEESAFA